MRLAVPSGIKTRGRQTVAAVLAFALLLSSALVASASVTLIEISADPYTNSTSQHKTQVEPDSFAFGSTFVSVFQSGRFYDGGASNIGFATSTNGGTSWRSGFLPSTTVFATPAGAYDRVSDPSVAYDAKHGVWLISSLALAQTGGGVTGAAVLVSRSTDGLTWSNPINVAVASGSSDLDKNWIVCDDTASSPDYGNCYTEYDDFGNGNQLHMSTSTDGGQTWTEASVPKLAVIGGQPVVQPSGTVVVPIDNAFETSIMAITSTDGGKTYGHRATISNITDHTVAGSLRTSPLPSAEVDGAGKVYVVWQDCRFERRCSANDIVMSTSTNGFNWSKPVRIPIDPVGSGVDHFVPGLAVDKATSGSTAHLGLTYYYYPIANCSASTCQLNVGFVGSTNGGTSWSTPTQLAGPMALSWLPNTSQGRMVGDYISTSFRADGPAFGVFAVANAPAGGSDCATATPNCDQSTYTPKGGLAAGASFVTTPIGEQPVPNAASDHAAPAARLTRR